MEWVWCLTKMEKSPNGRIWKKFRKKHTGFQNMRQNRRHHPFLQRRKKKNIYEIPYKYSQSRHMMRLANAKNVTSVRGVIAASQSEIGKVKLKISDPKEAAVIIRKIKNVIRNGNIKIARLHKEERLFRADVWRRNERKLCWNVSWQSSSAKKRLPVKRRNIVRQPHSMIFLENRL